jgi:NTP pyrophosphatase (non-canonical NTP hydrolase)
MVDPIEVIARIKCESDKTCLHNNRKIYLDDDAYLDVCKQIHLSGNINDRLFGLPIVNDDSVIYCEIKGVKMLNELRDTIHENAKAHGFYDDEKVNIPEKLMLIVSELGEAMEAYRSGKLNPNWRAFEFFVEQSDFNDSFRTYIKDCMEDELADTIIRLLDLCGYMKIDIDKHVELKMKYNESRPYKHGKIC